MIRIGIAGIQEERNPYLHEVMHFPELEYGGFYELPETITDHNHSFLSWLLTHDAVILSTPYSSHYAELLEIILKNGRHVLLTNPYAVPITVVNPALKMARESNVICMAGSDFFYHPLRAYTKQEIQLPLFIETQHLKPFHANHPMTDVVNSLMLHDILSVLQVVNSEIKYISASGVKVLSDSIDIANARIEFTNGTLANITASRIAQKRLHLSRVFQKDCYHVLNFLSNQADRVFLSEDKSSSQPLLTESKTILEVSPLTAMLSDFLASMQQQKNTGMSLDLSRKAQEVCDIILKKINFLGDE